MLTTDLLHELLYYDPETGNLIWKKRSEKFFPTPKSCAQWNGAWAGKLALNALDKKGYKVGAIFYKNYKAHRIIWFMFSGCWAEHIDHINGIKSDNRIENLRAVDDSENKKNRGIQKNNSSGVNGVFWASREKRWVAKIQVEYRKICLGYFQSLDEAVIARKDAEKRYNFHTNHGDRVRS